MHAPEATPPDDEVLDPYAQPPPPVQYPQYYDPYSYPRLGPGYAPRLVRRTPARRRLLAKLTLGYAYRHLFGEPAHAGAADLTLGTDGPSGGAGGRLSVEVGVAPSGARVEVVALGGAFDWKVGSRVRVGVAPTLGVFALHPVNGGPAYYALVLGTHLEATVDLAQSRRGGALYLAGRAGYDSVFFDDGVEGALSARLGLGYRL